MPRAAKVRWDDHAAAWRSDVGPHGKPGSYGKSRRTPVYFREIANTPKGRRQAEQALDAYLRDRDRREAESFHDAANPRVWSGVVRPYLEWVARQVEAGKLSPKTLRSHRERLARWLAFAPTLGVHAGTPTARRLARSLDYRDAELFVAGLEAGGCGPTRIDGVMRTIMACLNWAANPVPGRDPRVILPAGNPFAGVKVAPSRRSARRVPARCEMARFLRAARAAIGDGGPVLRDGRRCLGCKRAGRQVARPCRRNHGLRAVHDRAVVLLCRLQWHAIARPDELCRATWGEVESPHGPVPGWEPAAHVDELGHRLGLVRVRGKTTRVTGRMRQIPVVPSLTRSLERLRSSGLHPRWIFPRLTRGEGTSGRWDVEALARPVRMWRRAAGLPEDFVLYGFRHKGYTHAVGRGGLTADQAGAIGGTSGAVVSRVYLQEDLGALFANFEAVRRSGRH